MKAIIQNFRGIADAEIEICPIALIAGRNGAGKTSIARAVAAAITGETVPFDGVLKKDAGIMTRGGNAVAELQGDNWTASVTWPKCEPYAEGVPPRVSAIAAGLTHPLDMAPKDFAAFLIGLLGSSPSYDEMKALLAAQGVEEKAASEIWKVIEAQGWDAAHEQAKKTGLRMKGGWEEITAEKYGAQKAAAWLPADWKDALEGETEAALEEDVARAREAVTKAIGAQAVSSAERERLRQEAEKQPEWQKKREKAACEAGLIETEIKRIEDELRAHPSPHNRHVQPCPECGCEIGIEVAGSGINETSNRYLLTKAPATSVIGAKEAAKHHAGLSGTLANRKAALREAMREFQEAMRGEAQADEAAQRLAALGDEAPATPAHDLQAAQDWLARAERDLASSRRKHKASERAESIRRNQAVIEALDSQGLRKTKLAQSLAAFCQHHLAPLCTAFRMAALTIDEALALHVGSTPYKMLSASEQFRVRVILQIAIAQMQGDGLLIIDGADILDPAGRGALLTAVAGCGIPAIICMTLPRPDVAPPLAAMGAGQNYWVENATARAYDPHAFKERFAA